MPFAELAVSATPWQARALGELRATGERVVDGARPLPGLTPQELQIAQLAAAGETNRKIGEHLFLSPRTVQLSLVILRLALGGLVIPGKLRAGAVLREVAVACAWAFGLMAIIAVPFFFGFVAWRERWLHLPPLHFSLAVKPLMPLPSVSRFAINTTGPLTARTASGTPATRNMGIRLV